ncbi:GntR family transcriptional regulator [Bradyrhizobium sp. LTSP849]|jgi:DNA-binding GntR family transcriptional regulator|uniref:GntR family transcriptional regulator n=1 Tax=Bradyrhizobium sp. LTSP849 TaxID=1615890 RepID=UPI0005D17466|nr:GntR family transcriptional regulator [Bradyrhizobium sp. LTSP849]KJC48593.1 GntR family transcriptional regulator [Bradyrhizobium sp. LTSP849]
MSNDAVGLVGRDNLTARVFGELRLALMEGRFRPGHRFKIRELAETMGVSETPIREALMQLVRARVLDMQASRSIEVARLSAAQYEELRGIRILLEGLAAERATTRISKADIANLKKYHQALVAAERGRRWREAVQVNWQFHHTLYKAADAPELLEMIETIWLRNGPLLNMLYPHATPTYPGRHQHLNVLDGLTARNPEAVKQSIQADLLEGGARLLQLLQDIETGATPSELDAAVT